MSRRGLRACLAGAGAVLVTAALLSAGPAVGQPPSGPVVAGPIPGAVPGDPASGELAETYPFFSTPFDLAGEGYLEEEFYLSGLADGFDTAGEQVAGDVPYRTRIVVRRPAKPAHFNGTVLMEWQNVTAGYDLDALWNPEHVTRSGYTWVGVSAQRVGVDFLRTWSPTRYGELDVTGSGAHLADELSYDIFAQAARAVRAPQGTDPMGGLVVDEVLAIGASQSASRMTIYFDLVLPQVEPVFDGYAFIVGPAPSRVADEPVFQVLSETDVRTPLGRRADSEVYRRWEVAGSAHSGWNGQEYRRPISERDLPDGAPVFECDDPPFSRVPLHYVTTKAYDHLAAWVNGTQPPHAPYLEFSGPTTKLRNELGLAQGGIQLSQVSVPTARNTGDNTGETFCFLFGTHQPFDDPLLSELYPSHGRYVSAVARAGTGNVRAGFIDPADAIADLTEAARSGVGRP